MSARADCRSSTACTSTYLFAGAPKVGKPFFMGQLAYHVGTGQKLWDYVFGVEGTALMNS